MPNVEYRFVESGKEGPKAAFREIGAEARSAKRDVDAALKSFEQLGRIQRAGGTTAARARAGGRGATAADREAAADETRRQRQALRDRQSYQERLAKEVAASQQRRERDAQREQQKTAKEQDKARTYQERLAKEVATAQQRREKETQRTQARTAKEQERDLAKHRTNLKRQADERARDREKAHRATLRTQHAERTAERRGQTEAAQAARRKAAEDVALHRERERLRKKGIFGDVGGQLKGLAIGGALAAGAIGIGVTGAAARDALRLRELANRISINSRQAGQAAIDPATLQKEFERVAIATPGQTAIGVGEAMQGFVTKTGRADVARQSLGTFATVASATGSDIRDVSNAAADLFQKFDITGIEDMQDALAALTYQGKEGAFELRDAASNFARMSAAAARFGVGTGVQGVKTLGGLSQLAMASTGDPERAATAVEATLRQFVSQSDTIKKKFGVDVFKDKGKTQTNALQDVIVGTIAGAKGNQAALQKVFGDEGIKGITGLITTFNKATTATPGTEAEKTAAGIAALREQLRKAIDAPGDWAEVQKDAAQAQDDASAKLTQSWELLQSKVGDAVIPMLTSLAETIANSPGVIDAFIGTIENIITAIQAWIHVIELIAGVEKKRVPPEKQEQLKREEVAKIDKQIAAKEKAAGPLAGQVQQLLSENKFAEAGALQARMSPEARQAAIDLAGLRTQRAQAAKDVGVAQAETERVTDIQRNIRTKAQFMKEYEALGTKAPDVMRAVGKGGVTTGASMLEETAAQKEFRTAQEQATTEERTRLGVGEGQAGVELGIKGLSAFAAAAARAADAMNKMSAQNQPSPVG